MLVRALESEPARFSESAKVLGWIRPQRDGGQSPAGGAQGAYGMCPRLTLVAGNHAGASVVLKPGRHGYGAI